MSLEQKPFTRYHEEKKVDTFTVKFNERERTEFEKFKYVLQQDKDSTAIKQLAWIGSKVLLDKKTVQILEVVLNNFRINKNKGVFDFSENWLESVTKHLDK